MLNRKPRSQEPTLPLFDSSSLQNAAFAAVAIGVALTNPIFPLTTMNGEFLGKDLPKFGNRAEAKKIPDRTFEGKLEQSTYEFTYELQTLFGQRVKLMQAQGADEVMKDSPSLAEANDDFKYKIIRLVRSRAPKLLPPDVHSEKGFEVLMKETLPRYLQQHGYLLVQREFQFETPPDRPSFNKNYAIATIETNRACSAKLWGPQTVGARLLVAGSSAVSLDATGAKYPALSSIQPLHFKAGTIVYDDRVQAMSAPGSHSFFINSLNLDVQTENSRDKFASSYRKLAENLSADLKSASQEDLLQSYETYALGHADMELHVGRSTNTSRYRSDFARERYAVITQLAFSKNPEIVLAQCVEAYFTNSVSPLLDARRRVLKDIVDTLAQDYSRAYQKEMSDRDRRYCIEELGSVFKNSQAQKAVTATLRERYLAEYRGEPLHKDIDLGLFGLGLLLVSRVPARARRNAYKVSIGLRKDDLNTADVPGRIRDLLCIDELPSRYNWHRKIQGLNELYQAGGGKRICAENIIYSMWHHEYPLRAAARGCMSALPVRNLFAFEYLIFAESKIQSMPEEIRGDLGSALNQLQIHLPYDDVDVDTRLRGLIKLESICDQHEDKSVRYFGEILSYFIKEDYKLRRRENSLTQGEKRDSGASSEFTSSIS